MAVLIDENTKVICQGFTRSQGAIVEGRAIACSCNTTLKAT